MHVLFVPVYVCVHVYAVLCDICMVWCDVCVFAHDVCGVCMCVCYYFPVPYSAMVLELGW